MKRLLTIAAAAALAALVLAPIARAADQVTGSVIDPACKNVKVTDACHVTGAKQGHGMAISGRDGRLYLLTGTYTENKNAKLIPLIGKTVTASGKVTIAGADRMFDATSMSVAK